MDIHEVLNACNTRGGKILLGFYLFDKAAETILGTLAKNGLSPAGSTIGLTAHVAFSVVSWLLNLLKKGKDSWTKNKQPPPPPSPTSSK